MGDIDSTKCTKDLTPNACLWLADARKDSNTAAVIRVGYSFVDAGTWIRLHTGVDNRQLKLHLGLRVPAGNCASFTIGGERKGWTEGGVIFFDDSWEHEVWNNCTTHRAVLQVVVRHPDSSF